MLCSHLPHSVLACALLSPQGRSYDILGHRPYPISLNTKMSRQAHKIKLLLLLLVTMCSKNRDCTLERHWTIYGIHDVVVDKEGDFDYIPLFPRTILSSIFKKTEPICNAPKVLQTAMPHFYNFNLKLSYFSYWNKEKNHIKCLYICAHHKCRVGGQPPDTQLICLCTLDRVPGTQSHLQSPEGHPLHLHTAPLCIGLSLSCVRLSGFRTHLLQEAVPKTVWARCPFSVFTSLPE